MVHTWFFFLIFLSGILIYKSDYFHYVIASSSCILKPIFLFQLFITELLQRAATLWFLINLSDFRILCYVDCHDTWMYLVARFLKSPGYFLLFNKKKKKRHSVYFWLFKQKKDLKLHHSNPVNFFSSSMCHECYLPVEISTY